MFRSPPRPSRLPLPHPLAFISPARPNECSPGKRVCVCVCMAPPARLPLAWRGKSSRSAVARPSSPTAPPPSLQPVNTKSGKKAHITSSLRVKDRPPCERLLRAPLFPHIAGDYTLCHLRADLAFLPTQAPNIKYQLPSRPANTHALGITGHPRNKAGADVLLRPPNQDLDARIHTFAAAAQKLRGQEVPDVLLL